MIGLHVTITEGANGKPTIKIAPDGDGTLPEWDAAFHRFYQEVKKLAAALDAEAAKGIES